MLGDKYMIYDIRTYVEKASSIPSSLVYFLLRSDSGIFWVWGFQTSPQGLSKAAHFFTRKSIEWSPEHEPIPFSRVFLRVGRKSQVTTELRSLLDWNSLRSERIHLFFWGRIAEDQSVDLWAQWECVKMRYTSNFWSFYDGVDDFHGFPFTIMILSLL